MTEKNAANADEYRILDVMYLLMVAKQRRVLDDPLIVGLAETYHVSAAQICLRYALQKGVMPIAKSSSKERMQKNQDLFSFDLSQEDICRLDTLPPIGWSGEHPDRNRVSV